MVKATKVRLKGQLPNCGAVALEMLHNDLNPLPPRQDGTKAPAGGKGWPKVLATERMINDWYGDGYERTGVGVICGHGGLELFEFEGRAVEAGLLRQFFDRAERTGLSKLVGRIADGYYETTPSGGTHWFYRCPHPKSTKLADDVTGTTLIETKGKGGYAIVAPSNGKVHPEGGCWELVKGGWGSVAEITDDEHAALLDLARSFDQKPVTQAEPPRAAAQVDGNRPGDAFNAQASWADVLEPYGWTFQYEDDDREAYWRRPGRTYATQATTNYEGRDLLHVFSTNAAPFEAGTSYTKFTALTVLSSEKAHPSLDDFADVAKQLHEKNYMAKADAELDKLATKLRQALLTTEQVKALKPAPVLIGGYLVMDSLAMLWGPPDVGKTFLALDWALSVASTAESDWWHAAPMIGGPVVYVIAEGAGRFGKRIDAWERQHSADYAHQLVWLTQPINLAEKAYIKALLEVIADVQPVLIVFDTLARCILGVDENSNKEMGLIVDHLDEIRIATGACVLAIHHTGVDETRYRGATCVKGALNSELQLKPTGDEAFWLNVVRQKDDSRSHSLHMSRVPIEGSYSCVVVPDSPVDQEDKIAKGDKVTLDVLRRIQVEGGIATSVWRNSHDKIADRTFYDRRARLVRDGLVRDVGTDKRPLYVVAE